MSGETQDYSVSPHVLFALAGMETGVLGSVAMCVWFLGSSALAGGSAWTIPNLAASILYARAVLLSDFGMPSVAGIALIVVLGGIVGMFFGLVVRAHRNRPRIVLLAILAALMWFYFSQALFWNRLGVLAGIHLSPASNMAGHLIYGLVLGRYPSRLAAAKRRFGPGPADPAAPPPEGGSETPSGAMLE